MKRTNNDINSLLHVIVVLLLLPGFLWAGAARTITLPEVLKPDAIAVDENHIYITEFPTIYIYSLENLKLIKTFGKKGEGPGEIMSFNRAYLHTQPGGIILSTRHKVLYFTKQGEFIKQLKSNPSTWGGLKPVGNHFVSMARATKGDTYLISVNLYSHDIKMIKELQACRFWFQHETTGKDLETLNIQFPQHHVSKDKIFVKGVDEGFIIHVFDQNGNKLHTINRDYEKIKVTETDKKRYLDYFRTSTMFGKHFERLKDRFTFPRYFPAIQTFIAADGKLYIVTYKKQGAKSEVLILDSQGKLLRQVFLPIYPDDEIFSRILENRITKQISNAAFAIKNGKLYQIRENIEKKTWELDIYEIKY
jgi:hypothetical protein